MEAVFKVQGSDAHKSADTARAGGSHAIPLEQVQRVSPETPSVVSRANPAAASQGDRATLDRATPMSPVAGYETDRYRLVQPFTTKL
ncbi:MAG: hypothetical protein ACE5F1_03165 [Planctomycetota bacterium]